MTFDCVKEETLKDKKMIKLIYYIQAGFLETNIHLPLEFHEFWIIRNFLMCGDRKRELDHNKLLPHSSKFQYDVSRIVISSSLRTEVLKVLHSAHHGVTEMN